MLKFIHKEDIDSSNLTHKINISNLKENQDVLLIYEDACPEQYTWLLGSTKYIESQYISNTTKHIGTGLLEPQMFPHILAVPKENPDDDTLYNIMLPTSLDEYIQSLSRKHRSNFKRYLKDAELLNFNKIRVEDLPTNLLDWHRDSVVSAKVYDNYFISSVLTQLDNSWVIFEIKSGDQILGYNLGYIQNNTYFDIHFFHKDANKWSSVVIAYLISYCISLGIKYYNLGYGCDYKRKFVPDNQCLTNLLFNEEKEPKPELIHNFYNSGLIALRLNNESFWLELVDGKQYVSPSISNETLNLLKHYYPFVVGNKQTEQHYKAPIVEQQSLKDFYEKASSYLTAGTKYLLGKYMIKGYMNYYNALPLSVHLCRTPIKDIPTLPNLVDLLLSISDKYSINLIDSGVCFEKLDDNMYEALTCMLRYYPNSEDFIQSFKSKRRKDIKLILENLGSIKYAENLSEEYLHQYLDLCFDRFKDVFSILSFIYDVTVSKEPTKILQYESKDGEKALLSWVLIDGIWVYNSYFQITNGRPIAKEAVIASAKFIYEETANILFDLTSFTYFGDTRSYNDYKKTISNETRKVYGYTVGRSNSGIYPPYYNVDTKEWVL